jgi:formylglycine-generating enzyme
MAYRYFLGVLSLSYVLVGCMSLENSPEQENRQEISKHSSIESSKSKITTVDSETVLKLEQRTPVSVEKPPLEQRFEEVTPKLAESIAVAPAPRKTETPKKLVTPPVRPSQPVVVKPKPPKEKVRPKPLIVSDAGLRQKVSGAETGKTNGNSPEGSDSVHEDRTAKPVVQKNLEKALTEMPLNEWVEPNTGIVFRQIPFGCFYPGSPKTETGRGPLEDQGDRICLDSYWMSSTEVTRRQWFRLMGGNHKVSEDALPVSGVTWRQVQEFVYKLNGIHTGGRTFGLPKELQWEYSCRAKPDAGRIEHARYWESFGLSRPCEFETTSWVSGGCNNIKERNGPENVRSHAANTFGLFDMLGNVSEWTSDPLRPYKRRSGAQVLNVSSNRVVRGGNWLSSNPAEIRCASRQKMRQGDASELIGFRLVSDEK